MDLPKSLVENYLAAVDAQLPPEMRADVIAELRDTLTSKLEDKEASLGRAPAPAEVAATLKAFGHPLVIANRYRKHQQLIGPEVYPFYVVTLQWTLGIVFFLHMVLGVLSVSSARDPWVLLARFWSNVAPGLLGSFAIVTIVFLVIERAGGAPAIARSWSPRALSASTLSRPRSIWETLFEMAFEAIFLLLWSGAIRLPDAVSAALAERTTEHMLELGPIWATLHWPIFVVVALSFAVNALSLVQPGRLWTIAAGRVAVALASAVIIVLMIRADLFVVTDAGREQAWAGIAFWVDVTAKLALAVAAVIWIFEALASVNRAHRARGATAEV